MGIVSVVESLSFVFNCFGGEVRKKALLQRQFDAGKQLVDVGEKYNITTLPVMIGRELVDLYPPTNHVERWNVLIVGKNKNYILVNVKDLDIPNENFLLNNKGDPFLPKEISDFFNHVWDKTLAGHELQFFMIWEGKTYFVNTYSFLNGIKEIIGAIMFMRRVEFIPDFVTKQERDSIDFMADNNVFKKT
jgi:hypothetical protein